MTQTWTITHTRIVRICINWFLESPHIQLQSKDDIPFYTFSHRHILFLFPLTFPDVCPQKKKRLDCLMMATPGISTVNYNNTP